jgi:hypothetical protein
LFEEQGIYPRKENAAAGRTHRRHRCRRARSKSGRRISTAAGPYRRQTARPLGSGTVRLPEGSSARGAAPFRGGGVACGQPDPRRARGPHRPRHRPLRRSRPLGDERGRAGVHAAGVRPRRQALRAGGSERPRVAVQRRRG